MFPVALSVLGVAALLLIAIGARYLTSKTFLPYHEVVVGKAWTELDPGVQALMLGLLRMVGGGFVSLGVGILWLSVALNQGWPWAPWAILSIAALTLGATLAVAIRLRAFRPEAKTPIRPTLIVMLLIVIGAGLAVIFR